jgi:serine/threonine-protein kinase RsbW
MIAIRLHPSGQTVKSFQFRSTLYLHPIIDMLLAEVVPFLRPELRLGLQEALVNAALHGNGLDPDKKIIIQFLMTPTHYVWIIWDEGSGFCTEQKEQHDPLEESCLDCERGRGLYLMKQIFDEVQWNSQGNQLHLRRGLDRSPVIR